MTDLRRTDSEKGDLSSSQTGDSFQVETLDDLKRAKKMLSKRMASDTDLWLTLQKTQER